MREVEEFGGGVDEGEAEGDEGIDRGGDDAVEKKLAEHLPINPRCPYSPNSHIPSFFFNSSWLVHFLFFLLVFSAE